MHRETLPRFLVFDHKPLDSTLSGQTWNRFQLIASQNTSTVRRLQAVIESRVKKSWAIVAVFHLWYKDLDRGWKWFHIDCQGGENCMITRRTFGRRSLGVVSATLLPHMYGAAIKSTVNGVKIGAIS